MRWVRERLARSFLTSGLLVARAARPWYFFTGDLWLHLYNGSSSLLRSHSHEEFSAFMRPLLVPNESLLDITDRGWDRTNNLFQFWLRNQHLEKKYGRTESYKRAESTLTPKTLPSLATLVEIFHLQDWSYKSMQNKPGHDNHLEKEILETINPDTKCIRHLDFEDLLELAGCSVKGRNEFNHFCETNRIFEFFTKEYVTQLGAYLRERATKLSKKYKQDTITILEVGAGSGALSHFLMNETSLRYCNGEKSTVKVECIATDSGKSGLHTQADFEVLKLKFPAAISRFQPDIIICSWMPMDEDWSVYFRQFSFVKEYLLIGEYEDGCCGHNWFTWGSMKHKPNPNDVQYQGIAPQFSRLLSTSSLPFQKDYFEKFPVQSLFPLQYSRYDSRYFRGNSGTFSFRKQKQK